MLTNKKKELDGLLKYSIKDMLLKTGQFLLNIIYTVFWEEARCL